MTWGDKHERVEDEAADWLVRLTDDPEDAVLRAEFEHWHADDPLHREVWARTARAYDTIGQAPSAYREHWGSSAAKNPPHVLPRPHVSGVVTWFYRPRARRRAVGVAAIAALAACLVLAFAPSVLLRLRADRVTGTGEVAALTLTDGSSIRLGPESAIGVDYAGGLRQVRLLKGEAFFDVIHDSSHPFRVIAGDAVVTDLGTRFEVRREARGVAVAVRQGHVRVDDPTAQPPASADLLAGDWAMVSHASRTERGVLPAEDVAAWVNGQLVLHGRPIGEVVAALRPYYHGVILVEDDAFAGREVSGVYDLRHPVDTLRDLAASHGAKVRQISPWVLLVSPS